MIDHAHTVECSLSSFFACIAATKDYTGQCPEASISARILGQDPTTFEAY